MNSKPRIFLVLSALCLMMAGCSSPTVVTLQDGTQYVTKDAPKTKTKDGFYEFEDIAGKMVRVRADEVATIKPED
jgi:major membrane immunogen (membrane-anchored lipoprotein)